MILISTISVFCFLRFFFFVFNTKFNYVFKENLNLYIIYCNFVFLLLFIYFFFFFYKFEFCSNFLQSSETYTFIFFQNTNVKSLFINKLIATLLCFCLYSLVKLRLYRYNIQKAQYYLITIFIIQLGFYFLFASTDLFSIFLSLEFISFSTVTFLSLETKNARNLQIGFRYLILSGITASLFIFAILVCYFSFSTTNLYDIDLILLAKNAELVFHKTQILKLTLDFSFFKDFINFFFFNFIILFYILIKLYIFPGHKWALFIYENTSYASLFLLSFVIKYPFIYLFFFIVNNLLFKFSVVNLLDYITFLELINYLDFKVFFVVYFLATVKVFTKLLLIFLLTITVCISFFKASVSTNIKHFFYWSSLVNSFFLFLGFLIQQQGSTLFYESIIFFFIFYALTMFSIFVVLSLLQDKSNKDKAFYEVNNINSLSGLGYTLEGVVLLISFFSLIGLPPFNGFYSKLNVFNSFCNTIFVYLEQFISSYWASNNSYTIFVVIDSIELITILLIFFVLVISLIVTTYYYLRFIRVLFFGDKAYYHFRPKNVTFFFCLLILLQFFCLFNNSILLVLFSFVFI